MNFHLENIKKYLLEISIADEEKQMLLNQLAGADKEWAITNFNLDDTEKINRTTAILLGETIKELDQKRKVVDAQNKELEIEAALERVRSRTMAMHKSEELIEVIAILQKELTRLEFALNNCIFWIMKEEPPSATWWVAPVNNTQLPESYDVMFPSLPYFKAALQAWKQRNEKWNYKLTGEDKEITDNYIFSKTNLARIPEDVKKAFILSEEVYISISFYDYGGLHISTTHPLNEQQFDIINRFSKVFNQTYTRFLDLEKAEAQAREAQIETSLERVRSRSLAMHNTSELQDVIHTVHQELLHLNIAISGGSFITINGDIKKTLCCWGAGGTADTSEEVYIPLYEKPFCNNLINGIKKGTGFFTEEYTQEDKKEFFNFLFNHEPWSKLGDKQKKETLASPGGYARSCCVSQHTSIFIINHFGEKFSTADNDILQRFAKVFEQTYTRFLDLQKAETQAREAQIEASLERVRGKAMAMQNSDDLLTLIGHVFTESTRLGLVVDRCIVMIVNPKTLDTTWILANPEMPEKPVSFLVKNQQQPPYLAYLEAWQNHAEKWTYELAGEVKKDWDAFIFSETELVHLPDEVKIGMQSKEKVYLNASFSNFGNLTLSSFEKLPDNQFDILVRFSKVFDLTYTRYNDLKQAEAQAREAQIEAALEKVRSRSLSMHHSNELADAASILFQQVTNLGVNAFASVFHIWEPDGISTMCWANGGDRMQPPLRVPHTEELFHRRIYDAWQRGDDFFVMESADAELEATYRFLNKLTGGKEVLDNIEDAGFVIPKKQVTHCAFFLQGYVMFNTYEKVQKSHDIFKRFAKVFEQTYTRFLDLQMAEAQAREGQIELALERVRARTMAMQKSNELREVVSIIYEQLQQLGFSYGALGIVIMDNISGDMNWWMAGFGKENYPENYNVPYFDHPFYLAQLSSWKEGKKYAVLKVSGEDKKRYDQIIFNQTDFVKIPSQAKIIMSGLEKITFSNAYMKHGALSWGTVPINDEYAKMLQRFAVVFEQTYTRFLDLQKAEAQAREAQIELALERVRARTMAMQRSTELREIVAIMLEQLQNLGFTYGACSIVIIEKISSDMIWWISGFEKEYPDSYRIPYFDHPFFIEQVSAWKEGKKYAVLEVSGERKKSYDKIVFSQSEFVRIPAETQKVMIGFEKAIFSNAYMDYGFLSWSVEPISDELAKILQRFAKVFEQSYTRFLDLQKVEAQVLRAEQDLKEIKAARKKAEDTLTELQATQKQLIQSEKMASLGELTAGIAHEIQNPINFVNNFSEVSKELIDEMRESIEKGDTEEAKEIMNDVIQNLEKINHHGKRADAIVKGMLQHSRSSSGVKELTDINALCDEYLRLAYHGLRAKDKDFNATIKTDFDESIGSINIIPQDIGRVLLNLYNNAFYAAPLPPEGGGLDPAYKHEPTIWVSTKKNTTPLGDEGVFISVRDNGPGIPQKIVDKIFQPFFTTKPTGQGTGLGLSLSYDIVKAHGGELKVNSNVIDGADFIIILPIHLI